MAVDKKSSEREREGERKLPYSYKLSTVLMFDLFRIFLEVRPFLRPNIFTMAYMTELGLLYTYHIHLIFFFERGF